MMFTGQSDKTRIIAIGLEMLEKESSLLDSRIKALRNLLGSTAADVTTLRNDYFLLEKKLDRATAVIDLLLDKLNYKVVDPSKKGLVLKSKQRGLGAKGI